MLSLPKGVNSTMLSAYKADGTLDFEAQAALIDWYAYKGVKSLFAMCHSTEMHLLSMEERLSLIRFVRSYIDRKAYAMPVIAAGTFSHSPDEMAKEVKQVFDSGADAVVMITNRLDPENKGGDTLMKTGEALLDMLPHDLPLGLYECPEPYKRVLTNREMQWAVDTGRVCFLKDTCCDPELLTARLDITRGSRLQLFNANSQTLLQTLRQGAAGYSSCMANVYPELYVWLIEHFEEYPAQAEHLQQILCLGSFIETLSYPLVAKYILRKEGVPIELNSRLMPCDRLTPYHKCVMDQLYALAADEKSRLPGGC